MTRYLLGIDQGSSGTKAVIINEGGDVCAFAYRPLERYYPRIGWVEQDPIAVVQGVTEAVTESIHKAGIHPREIIGCGIAGQRNTAFVWDDRTGKPIANAITWQDQRTAPLLAEFAQWPHAAEAQHRLGYEPGTYMAALHLAWLMRYHEGFKRAADTGHLQIGLSPAWIVSALGHRQGHLMDTSLTQALGLYDIREKRYWPEWLSWLGLPESALPTSVPTLHHYGELTVTGPGGETADIPVLAMIGDQQGALFGQNCRTIGAAECTHGTASYVKVFLDQQAPQTENIYVYNAWHLGQHQTYCLEAPTMITGAAIRWMRDNARLFNDYQEMDVIASKVEDAGGVVFIPAFTGIEFPEIDARARGTIFGLTLSSHRGHIFRAFFEAIGYQIRTILETIQSETHLTVDELLVGGGVSSSDLACQIQADLLGIPVLRPTFTETTAWAAGLLAGIGAGVWAAESPPTLPGTRERFEPAWGQDERDNGYGYWQEAVAHVRSWGRVEKNKDLL